jgi:putative flippase GtrA
MSRPDPTERWSATFARHLPPVQFGRYLLVGAGNTLFGFGCYAALTAILTPHIPHAYILAAALSNLFNITFSYLTYKWFIFRTRGNYVREWMRCVAVYSGASLLAVLVLPVIVFLIRHLTPLYASAPYLAGAMVAAATAIASFTGHKNFTFRSAKLEQSKESQTGERYLQQ